MYQIKITDLAEEFKRFPNNERYCLFFGSNFNLYFSSKRKAYKTASYISQLFVEYLAICEMVNVITNNHSHVLKPNSKSSNSNFSKFYENLSNINLLFRDIKIYNNTNVELHRLYSDFIRLSDYLLKNCEILNKVGNNCVMPYMLVLINSNRGINRSFSNLLANSEQRQATLFLT